MALNITRYDFVTVSSERVTVGFIVWKHYRIATRGVVEAMMDLNPHLARLHKVSPFLPVGTQVRIPIDEAVFAGRPQPVLTSTIAGTVL